ncbi:hypothetical protein F3Y22_tig00109957pilonHSYRG00148 [Hibiscus syriacus]|uniref:RING-type E3 ubiquitin transferase n=1 Tax=Hibiscus syriacus TaxID=106335 RepID=A0A6A3BSL0_HIBSY|nr:hypothetical protein F3Y22_tig00109957pilonHSYRG00148 [Hibiscus syriacus]
MVVTHHMLRCLRSSSSLLEPLVEARQRLERGVREAVGIVPRVMLEGSGPLDLLRLRLRLGLPFPLPPYSNSISPFFQSPAPYSNMISPFFQSPASEEKPVGTVPGCMGKKLARTTMVVYRERAVDIDFRRGETLEEEKGISAANAKQNEPDLVQESVSLIEYIARLGDFRSTLRQECYSLVRRMKILLPFFEEIWLLGVCIPPNVVAALSKLKKVLCLAKKLLKTCRVGSKIFLRQAMMVKFHAVYENLCQALDDLPCDEIDVSVEVKEQVELMVTQLWRGKRRTHSQDMELAVDLMVLSSETDERTADIAIIERLAKKLDLRTMLGMEVTDIFKESVKPKMLEKSMSFVIPHEFLCPTTLYVMRDPVIIASGQTFERDSIQKWFDSNNRTCPNTEANAGSLVARTESCPQEPYYTMGGKGYSYAYEGAPGELNVLRHGSMESRENSTAALFSLSMLDENKVMIALSEGIPALARAIDAGIVPPLKLLVKDRRTGMVDEALSMFLLLVTHPQGRYKIGQLSFIEMLVDIIRDGTPKNKE